METHAGGIIKSKCEQSNLNKRLYNVYHCLRIQYRAIVCFDMIKLKPFY